MDVTVTHFYSVKLHIRLYDEEKPDSLIYKQ